MKRAIELDIAARAERSKVIWTAAPSRCPNISVARLPFGVACKSKRDGKNPSMIFSSVTVGSPGVKVGSKQCKRSTWLSRLPLYTAVCERFRRWMDAKFPRVTGDRVDG